MTRCLWITIVCSMLFLLAGAPLFGQEPKLIDPENFKKEILGKMGVSYQVFKDFADSVSGPARPFTGKLDKPVRIGFVTPSFDISDAWERWYWSMYLRLEEAGVPFEVTLQATSRHDAHDEQLAQVESLIAAGVDFIVLGPTELDAQRVAINKVHEAGIPLIILNFCRPLEGDDKTLMYVAFDHEFGGYLTGVHIAKVTGGKGKLAGLRMIPGTLDDQRWGGAMAVIKQTDIEVVYETYAEANRQKAYEATMDIMTAHPDLNVIYATSTAMAIGAVAALETLGRLDVAVYGFGGTADEIDAMLKGKQMGSVFRFQDDAGVAVAEAIQRYLEGKKDSIPQSYMGDMVMTDKTLSRDQFKELVERGFRYSKTKKPVKF
ncbi:MAG: substrate-binding domain-containing protein [Atribacterota bacterium]